MTGLPPTLFMGKCHDVPLVPSSPMSTGGCQPITPSQGTPSGCQPAQGQALGAPGALPPLQKHGTQVDPQELFSVHPKPHLKVVFSTPSV